jgi:hypothetical protein
MTKKIKLSQNKTAQVDNAMFDYINQWKWFALKDNNTFYAVSFIGGKQIKMHRIIIECSANEIIDHRDGNGLNNQTSNLRICTTSQNMQNKKTPSNNTSGYKGVHFHKPRNKFVARIFYDNKRIFLGYFTDATHAFAALSQPCPGIQMPYIFTM